MAKKASAFDSILEEKSPPKGGGGKDYDTFKFSEIGPGDINLFDSVAGLKTGIKIMESEVSNIEEQLKDGDLLDKFVEIGCNSGKAPGTFVGQGEVSSAKITLKYKATSHLDQQTQDLLEENGIDLDIKEVVSIKKNVLEDENMVLKIIDALRGAGINPGDVLDRSKKVVASDKTIDSIFEKVSDKKQVKDMLRKVGTVVFGAATFSEDPVDAKAKVSDIVNSFGVFSK